MLSLLEFSTQTDHIVNGVAAKHCGIINTSTTMTFCIAGSQNLALLRN